MFNIFHVHKASAPKCHEIHHKIPALHDPSENATYQSLSVEKKLGNTKFPVYSVFSKINKQHYAMKMFPFSNDHPCENFHNEARFTFLKHPNVINFAHCEKQRETLHKNEVSKASYILMEYAQQGDFFDFVLKHRDQVDEKLARTYFKQLIEGIEYLHENGVAHLDLKPENLMLGDDFNLKIIDFDLSYMQGDPKVMSRGTKYYRAPELYRPDATHVGSKRTFAADIYSAGIILFILKSGGIYPHAEDDEFQGLDLMELMYHDNKGFWEQHCEIERKESSFYDKNFRDLFNGMVKEKPGQRMSIKQIKKSKWYNGPIYSSSELAEKMKEILGIKEAN